MLNALLKLSSLAILALIGVGGLMLYRSQTAQATKVNELETLASQQRDVIDRLEFERRMADIVVAGQTRGQDGKLRTDLLIIEYDRAGRALPPRSASVVGDQVHVDALVVKYDAKAIEKPADPLHGHALLLFEKIYGDAQAPADATRLDPPDRVPAVYRDGADPKVTATEQEIWRQFWQLASDATLRRRFGIKVAHGAGVFAPFMPGVRYTITLAADGNLTLYDEPLSPLLKVLLDRGTATTLPTP